MQQYLDLMKHVRIHGTVKTDRTGTGTKSIFGHQMRFNLSKGFPLLTTKKVHMKSIIHELIWFLAGDTNIKYLQDNGVKIWDEWADANGDLGPVYGGQWRRWKDYKLVRDTGIAVAGASELEKQGYRYVDNVVDGGVRKSLYHKEYDQISDVINTLKNSPDSRRIMVSAWNVGDISSMKLPPCHSLFQFYVEDLSLDARIEWVNKYGQRYQRYIPLTSAEAEEVEDHKRLDQLGIPRQRLSCQLYQRSADIFLGVPFNVASYALLTHMVAQQVNMAVGDFVWTGGDCHLYSNHMDQVETQLQRDTRDLPQLVIKRKPESIFEYKYEDFEVVGYNPHDAIKAPVAV